MTGMDYKLARDKARNELRNLLGSRTKLDAELAKVNTRIAEVTQGVAALDLLVGDGTSNQTEVMLEIAGLNLSDAVRAVLRRADLHLTPLEIMMRLRKAGYRMSDYTNPQASINTMLKRLVDSGQANTIIKDHKTAYRFINEE